MTSTPRVWWVWRTIRSFVDAYRVNPTTGLPYSVERQLEKHRNHPNYQQMIADAIRHEERSNSRWL